MKLEDVDRQDAEDALSRIGNRMGKLPADVTLLAYIARLLEQVADPILVADLEAGEIEHEAPDSASSARELRAAIDEIPDEELELEQESRESAYHRTVEELTHLLAGRLVQHAGQPGDRRGPLALSSARQLAEAITEKLVGWRPDES